MYPVLILRCELVCLVILIFLYFTSRAYNVDLESKSFSRLLCFAIIHVVFDAITILTVNNTAVVPEWLNWICHIIFYLSAILFSNEIVNYVFAICYPHYAKKLYILGLILTGIYICCLPFLEISYIESAGTWSSYGPAAIAGYGLAFSFFIFSLVIIFTHMDKMSYSIKSTLIPMMLVLIITEICQIIWPSVLFTGGAITIVTVGFFFSMENPVAVFKQKAMTDALTGVHSRQSYEEDMNKFDNAFREKPGDNYIFVFIDINDLRSVNNQFGHAEGDNYITLIASSINQCMKHAHTIYRIGGDEFLILYYNEKEAVVEKEISNLKKTCAAASEKLAYRADVAAGYAASSDTYRSLRDVVKTADYAMYVNKADEKSRNNKKGGSYGTKLNYSGLTDKTFEVICASNENNYPFITNLDTNVTRISPAWRDYFGLEDEFFPDFIAVWKEHIHPDYFDGYLADITEVISGHRKYHHYDYLAKRADGKYVNVSCHGSVYTDSISGTSFFTGFIINHGLDENTDKVTGLKNFDQLTIGFYEHMDNGRPFSVMRLMLNNFARINMLYGYSEGNALLKKIALILSDELGGAGEVYCRNSTSFSILFDSCDKEFLEKYYRRISEKLSSGIEMAAGPVPVLISGGAYVNTGEKYDNKQMRSGLIYAAEESFHNRQSRLVFYPDLNNDINDDDVSLLADIHSDALTSQTYFQLRYQPIIDMESGRTMAAEALLRWIHPKYGEVKPDKFIAFLENDPCYYHLGLGILEHAVIDAQEFGKVVPGFKINVNITAIQLQNENFINDVFDILNRNNFDPGCLVLELTERCKEMESRFLAERIAEFRSRGIQIAFDDLGTGYSTISLLMDIPVDEIKLDRDFVRDMGSRENYQLFVRTLIVGASKGEHKYNICFEGIENDAMLDEIHGYGEFLAQGYYFAKPLLKEDFAKFISERSVSL